MEYKTTYPELEALKTKRALPTEAEIEEARKRDAIYLENMKKKYEAEYKVDMDEYWKLFNADKQRFLDMGCSEKTAHAQACGLAQYREDKRLGLSTD